MFNDVESVNGVIHVEMVCKLAEGEDITKARSISAWTISGYIFGGLIGVIMIMIAISFLIEVFELF